MKAIRSPRLLLPDPMATLAAIPILIGLMILQTSILSRVPLLQGTTDLVMLALIAWALQERVKTAWNWSIIGGLIFTVASAVPVGVALVSYGLITWLALGLRRHVWRLPILAMFLTAVLGTLITHALTYLALTLSGDPLPAWETFNLITLPSVLLNLVAAIPVYLVISDLAHWIYPEELEV